MRSGRSLWYNLTKGTVPTGEEQNPGQGLIKMTVQEQLSIDTISKEWLKGLACLYTGGEAVANP